MTPTFFARCLGAALFVAVGVPTATAAAAQELKPGFGCSVTPTLDPTDPNFLGGDIPNSGGQQNDVDCFAWQSFAALNWPVTASWPAQPGDAGMPDRTVSAKEWGDPVDPRSPRARPTAWETFMPVQALFVGAGETPAKWGELPTAACAGQGAVTAAGPIPRLLTSTGKVGLSLSEVRERLGADANPDEFEEAFGGWLTDQAGRLVWFERLVNEAEYDYILAPDGVGADTLITKAGQMTVAGNANGEHPNGLLFPQGIRPQGGIQPPGDLGAIELKAAWRVLTDEPDLWPRFLLSKAALVDPDTNRCTVEVLGLVGLHIIRSTSTFPDFLWATFEHVDNAPQPSAPYSDPYDHPHGWSFHDPDCTGNCTPNVARVDKHGKPLFPKSQPVQVTRQFPIPPQVMQLNLAMQQMIAAANPDSVFQYYQLVNVLWNPSPVPPITGPGRTAPLTASSFTSALSTPVANTTMETYAQTTNCTVCHKGATVKDGTLASDFSFIFLQTKQ